MKYKIGFVDLDGTLCDCHGAIQRLMGKEVVTTPEYRALGADFRIPYELSNEAWSTITAAGSTFWENMEPLPWKNDLMEICSKYCEKIYVVTSPGGSTAAGATVGKIAWCQKHLPKLKITDIIFTGHKYLMAAPDRLLVDDSEEVLKKYLFAGGPIVGIPQPWNHLAGLTSMSVAQYVLQTI